MSAPGLEVDADGGVLRLTGRLVFANAAAAYKAVGASLSGTIARIDLHGLTATDSSALACLLAWRAQFAARGQALELSGTPDNLRALAQVSGVAELLDVPAA